MGLIRSVLRDLFFKLAMDGQRSAEKSNGRYPVAEFLDAARSRLFDARVR